MKIDAETTLPALAEQGLERNAGGIAVSCRYGREWRDTTVADFRTAVAEIALALHARGVRHGDRVCLHSENRTEWLLADLAILSIGAVSVPIYATQPADQVRYILKHCEAKVLFVSNAELWRTSGAFIADFPDLDVVGFDGAWHGQMTPLADFRKEGAHLARTEPELSARLRAEVTPDDLASITYTSGTTGVPKGVMLTHRNLAFSILASQTRAFSARNRKPGDRMLSFLPYAHIYEHGVIYSYLQLGAHVFIVPNTDNLLEDIQHVRPAHFATVPRLLEKVYGAIHTKVGAARGVKGALGRWALKVAHRYDVEKGGGLAHRIADRLVFSKMRATMGGNIRGISSGGAALSAEIARFFIAIGIPVGEGYGLTETSPVITTYDPERLRPGSVGLPLPGVEVQIAPDGEILARGPNVMQGYYKMPEQTADVLTADGWFHTGDIGHMDAEGFLYITDRKKELFKLSTGKYVAPAPIENRLICHPVIEQVVIVGNGQKFTGALIFPLVEAIRDRLGHEPSQEEVRAILQDAVDAANAGLPPWEQVKKFEVLSEPMSVETGEYTPTLKRKRAQIATRRHAEIARIYKGA